MCIKIGNRKLGNERTCRLINLFEYKVFLSFIAGKIYVFLCVSLTVTRATLVASKADICFLLPFRFISGRVTRAGGSGFDSRKGHVFSLLSSPYPL